MILIRLCKWLLFAGLLLAAGGVAAGVAVVWWFSRDLPDHEILAAYEPRVMTRVHAADGSGVAVFARENRVFVPIEEIPERVRQAFISAEDKNFRTHRGVDPVGIFRAVIQNVENTLTGRRLQGASTITQQVAKNMLLTGEVSYVRKIREGILAVRLGRALDKDRILELYLNEIFLGQRAYGVAAAALAYFGKSLDDLALHEAAYLAALPKGPNNYHPLRHPQRALDRRAYVLARLAEDGHVTVAEAEAAAALPLGTRLGRSDPASIDSGGYFIEEVRRQLLREFGEDTLYEGGLSVRTTMVPEMQATAETLLQEALETFDRKLGYAGPLARIEGVDSLAEAEWRRQLAAVAAPRDVAGWRPAVLLAVDAEGADIGVEGVKDGGRLQRPEWARPRRSAGDVSWTPGDVVMVSPTGAETGAETGPRHWQLRQVPEIQGALLAMDAHTGRVLAMQGGFSYQSSSFNRSTQAERQPGSLFKPLVYAAALDQGYTPATRVLDAPLLLEQGEGLEKWQPENSNRVAFAGPTPLRRGVEESRNLMTVRVARDIGLTHVAAYARQLGVYADMPPLLSYALGAGETTLAQLVRAYAVFANGGKRVEQVLIDRVQDRRGNTVFRRDDRPCVGCVAAEWVGQEEPYVPSEGEEVLDPVTAFQITWMLQGVVERGSGRAAAVEGRRIAGKTGTTNQNRDAWFVGYTPEIVIGCYIGYDTPRTLGAGGFGGALCAPVVGAFVRSLPETRSGFRRPAGLEFAPVEHATGNRVAEGQLSAGVILEAFRAGTAPSPDDTVPALDLQSGTGGLY